LIFILLRAAQRDCRKTWFILYELYPNTGSRCTIGKPSDPPTWSWLGAILS